MSDIRVLGKRLGQRIGQEAILLGRITGCVWYDSQKSSDGMSTEITTTDDVRVNVSLPERLDFASGYIEVRGTVKSKSTMSCNNFVCLPPSMTKDFDANGYNTMIHIRCALGNQLEGAFYGD